MRWWGGQCMEESKKKGKAERWRKEKKSKVREKLKRKSPISFILGWSSRKPKTTQPRGHLILPLRLCTCVQQTYIYSVLERCVQLLMGCVWAIPAFTMCGRALALCACVTLMRVFFFLCECTCCCEFTAGLNANLSCIFQCVQCKEISPCVPTSLSVCDCDFFFFFGTTHCSATHSTSLWRYNLNVLFVYWSVASSSYSNSFCSLVYFAIDLSPTQYWLFLFFFTLISCLCTLRHGPPSSDYFLCVSLPPYQWNSIPFWNSPTALQSPCHMAVYRRKGQGKLSRSQALWDGMMAGVSGKNWTRNWRERGNPVRHRTGEKDPLDHRKSPFDLLIIRSDYLHLNFAYLAYWLWPLF